MMDDNKTPLDFDEVIDKKKQVSTISPAQRRFQNLEVVPLIPVSYTHLTLPTKA